MEVDRELREMICGERVDSRFQARVPGRDLPHSNA